MRRPAVHRRAGLVCRTALALVAVPLALTGCGGPTSSAAPKRAARPPDTRPQHVGAALPSPFSDVTAAAGIDFVHHNGASPRRYLPETMGAGAAFFDYDGDDHPDLYLVDSGTIAPQDAPSPPVTGALYRNRGDGTFAEVTREAGLAVPGYGLGAAVGDVDNDGDLDLFVSGVGGDRFFRNRGDGTFAEAEAAMGLVDRGFGSSAAFVDVDRDGWLDLFVGRYVTWSRESDLRCSPDREHPTYCTPELYAGQSNRLYRNLGGERFVDVTTAAGVERLDGKTLGVVPLDRDRDGWPDLAVANDTARNFLWVNQGDGTFREAGVETGLAFSLSGATRGAMGIDAGDLSGDGLEDVVIGNFSQEMSALYRATGTGFYVDEAAQQGIGVPSLMTLAFGTLLLDVDGDGWLDVLFANGHIEPDIALYQPLLSYAQLPQLFRNRGPGRGFELVTASDGPLATAWVGRGLAAADYDGDGDLDVVLTQNGRAARLWRNDSPPRSWLRVKLRGQQSNRTGYGAVVTAVAGERRLVRTLVSGRSYLSASEPVVTFGLGDLRRLDRLEIAWPSGVVQKIPDPELGRLLVVEEPAG